MACKTGETVREHWAHGGGMEDLPGYDEDLTAPGHLLHLRVPRLDPERIGGAVARGAVRLARDPEFLAAAAGGTLLPLIVFRGRRPPLIPWLIIALLGEQAGLMAWRSYTNLQVIAQAAAGQRSEERRVGKECTIQCRSRWSPYH